MASTSSERVFIGVPTYNRPAGLRRAVTKLLEQSHENITILISDNASTDPEVEDIGRWLASSDARVKYVRQKTNLGPVANFTFVLSQADAPFFMWNADDDSRSNDCISQYLDGIHASGGYFTTYATFDTRTDHVIQKMEVPLLTGSPSNTSDMYSILRAPCPSMIYGLLRTHAAKACWSEQAFDWCDCHFIVKLMTRFGYRTGRSEPTYFAGIPGEYVLKPFNGKQLRPWQYISKTLPLALSSGFRPTLAHLRTSAALLKKFA